MNTRLLLLSVTVSLTLLMTIPSVGLANGFEKSTCKSSSEQKLKYDPKMVEKVPAKSKRVAPGLSYTVMSWRPYL